MPTEKTRPGDSDSGSGAFLVATSANGGCPRISLLKSAPTDRGVLCKQLCQPPSPPLTYDPSSEAWPSDSVGLIVLANPLAILTSAPEAMFTHADYRLGRLHECPSEPLIRQLDLAHRSSSPVTTRNSCAPSDSQRIAVANAVSLSRIKLVCEAQTKKLSPLHRSHRYEGWSQSNNSPCPPRQ